MFCVYCTHILMYVSLLEAFMDIYTTSLIIITQFLPVSKQPKILTISFIQLQTVNKFMRYYTDFKFISVKIITKRMYFACIVSPQNSQSTRPMFLDEFLIIEFSVFITVSLNQQAIFNLLQYLNILLLVSPYLVPLEIAFVKMCT